MQERIKTLWKPVDCGFVLAEELCRIPYLFYLAEFCLEDAFRPISCMLVVNEYCQLYKTCIYVYSSILLRMSKLWAHLTLYSLRICLGVLPLRMISQNYHQTRGGKNCSQSWMN